MKLDIITVKPYLTWKNLLIIFGLPVFWAYFMDSDLFLLFLLMTSGMMLASYPFTVGEQNGIDALYVTLSIQRKNTVLGRYLFVIGVDLAMCLVGLLCIGLTAVLKNAAPDWAETLTVVCVGFAFFTFVHAVQLPLFFRLGYAKAKVLSVLPFMLVPLAVLGYGSMQKWAESFFAAAGAWLTANASLAVILAVVLWLAVMFVSYDISHAGYRKREF